MNFPQISFEYKITLGNVMMMLGIIGAAGLGYIDLQYKVEQLSNDVTTIPKLQDRLVSVEDGLASMEARGDIARADRAALNLKVIDVEKTLNLILQSNARIEERVGNLQEQMRQNANR